MLKKVLSITLTLAMLISTMSVFATEITPEFKAETIVSEEVTNYRPLKTKENGKVCAAVTIPASVFDSGVEQANLYIATYSNENSKSLEAVAVKEITSADAGQTVYTPAIEVNQNNELKAFVWNGLNVSPVAMPAQLPAKTLRTGTDFETGFTLGESPSGIDDISGSGITVVADPEENGTRGNVVKVQGTYDSATNSAKSGAGIKFSELETYLGAWNGDTRKSIGYIAVDYEFDIYFENNFTYQKSDGSSANEHLMYDILTGDGNEYTAFRFTLNKSGSRITFNDRHYEMPEKDLSNYTNLFNRWIHVKIETRPYQYVNDEGKVTYDLSKCEYKFWFDDQLIWHSTGTKHANVNSALGRNGCDGRLIFRANAGNTYTYARPFYIDNVKCSY